MQPTAPADHRAALFRVGAPWRAAGDRASLFICLVFFVSGFPALIYQLVWQRALFIQFGVNIESVTVVVAGFMAGLGLGSLLGGELSHRRPLPLLVMFSGIELSIAGFGFLSLRLFALVAQATLHAPGGVVLLLPLLLLLVPTLLMGATLPILVMYLVERSRLVGVSVGLLYFLNTLGSSLSCFVVALWMMRALGMHDAIIAACGLNLLVGASAALLHALGGSEASAEIREAAPPAAGSGPRIPQRLGLSLAAATGFLSLSYEIVWVRYFSFVSGTSALAFGLVLGAFLAGVALGSFAASALCEGDRQRDGALRALIAVIILGSTAGFFYVPASDWLITSGASKFVYGPIMLFGIAAAAGLMGSVLPLLSELSIAPDGRAGANLSRLYLANIAGAVAGSLGTGFVLMDHLGLGTLSAVLAIAGLSLGLTLLVGGPRQPFDRFVSAACGAGIVAVAAGATPLFSGVYDRILFRTAYSGAASFAFGHVVSTVENKHDVINVTSDKVAFGGGMYDGVISVDLIDDRNNLERPFALSLFSPAPRDVLMIGLGTGAWAQVLAAHPQLKKLTIVEINPGYLQIISRYPEVASLLRDPKVKVDIDDGRRWLNRHPNRKFDAIIQNTTWFFRSNASDLLSREYLELGLAHLKKQGVIMYNTTNSDRAQLTACLTAPAAMRLSTTMVISNDFLSPDPARWENILLAYEINGRRVIDPTSAQQRRRLAALRADIQAMPAPGEQRPPAFLESCRSILARTAGLQPITDDNMGEEWNFLKFDRVFAAQ